MDKSRFAKVKVSDAITNTLSIDFQRFKQLSRTISDSACVNALDSLNDTLLLGLANRFLHLHTDAMVVVVR